MNLVGPISNNLSNLPNPNVNMKAFPQLGAYPGEVGPGTSPGGIGIIVPSYGFPLSYWWGFGRKKSKISKRRSKRKSKISKRRSKRKSKISKRRKRRSKRRKRRSKRRRRRRSKRKN